MTPERWADLEELFGPRGASGGCWCMWWRLKRSDFDAAKGDANHDAFRRIVENGEVPGLLLYVEGRPVGWCAVQPRERFAVLGRSRALRPIDDVDAWSVVCLYVHKAYRRTGVSVELLEAAAEHAMANGAEAVEGYPVEPKTGSMPAAFAWTGTVSAFRAAGYTEVGRGPTGRVIMRRAG